MLKSLWGSLDRLEVRLQYKNTGWSIFPAWYSKKSEDNSPLCSVLSETPRLLGCFSPCSFIGQNQLQLKKPSTQTSSRLQHLKGTVSWSERAGPPVSPLSELTGFSSFSCRGLVAPLLWSSRSYFSMTWTLVQETGTGCVQSFTETYWPPKHHRFEQKGQKSESKLTDACPHRWYYYKSDLNLSYFL